MLLKCRALNSLSLPIVRRMMSSSSLSKSQFWHSEGKEGSDTAVLVCGWAGSKRNNVEKYTDLFAKQFGLQSFGCILPMADFTSFDHGRQSRFARKVLSEMSVKTGASVDLVVLSLSNNGASVYQHVVHLCKEEKALAKKFKIAGAVFDSGPGPVTFFSYFLCGLNLGSHEFLQNLVTRTKLTRPIAPPLLHFYLERLDKTKTFTDLISSSLDVQKRFGGNWEKFSEKWPWVGHHVLDEKESWPISFLYSDVDDMMPSAFIKRIAANQKSTNRQRQVFEHNFVTSPHVCHLREQPDVYQKQIEQFLKAALK